VVDTGKYIVLDARSVYLFIACHDRVKRFAVYHPDFSGIDRKSDNRYTRQIRRMIRYIKRNYLWLKLTKKRKA